MTDNQSIPKTSGSWFKRLFFLFAGFLGILVITAFVLPFVIDVDQYRPEITQKINEKINGEVELGKLTLSLWGKILIRIDELKVKDVQSKTLVSVKDASFYLPFWSIFGGAPLLTLGMEKPEISVVRNQEGKINLLSLIKMEEVTKKMPQASSSSPPPQAQSQAPSQTQAAKPKSPAPKKTNETKTNESALRAFVVGLAAKSRVGIDIRNALIQFQDQKNAFQTRIQDLNIVLKDLSLDRPTEFRVWADLDSKLAKQLKVEGPFQLSAKLTPTFQGVEYESAKLDLTLDLDSLMMESPGVFKKEKGVVTNLKTTLVASGDQVEIQKINVNFHNLEVRANGKVTNLDQPTIQLKAKSNVFDLEKWHSISPQLKTYQVQGGTSFEVSVKGLVSDFTYAVETTLKDLRFSHPMLKVKPKVQVSAKLTPDQIDRFQVVMKAGKSDFTVQGNLKSFSQPQIQGSIRSKRIDVDELMGDPKKKSARFSLLNEAFADSGAQKSEDYDALLAPLRAIPILQKLGMKWDLSIDQLMARGMTIGGVKTQFVLQSLVGSLNGLRLTVFDGLINGNMNFNLNPTRPTYSLSGEVRSLDMKKAVESQLALFKNTAYGKLNVKVRGQGSSFNPPLAKKNLTLQGNLRIDDGKFSSIDVAKMTIDAINSSIDRVAKNVQQLKGKKLKVPANRTSEYKVMKSRFSLSKGRFIAPDFVAQAVEKKGIDLEGYTEVGILDDSLNARWKIIDRYNVTRARDVSVKVQGVDVKNVLAAGNPPVVSFPVTVKGKITSPAYSYGEVPNHFKKIALNNLKKATTSKLKSDAKKKILKKAPKQLKKIFKGLF